MRISASASSSSKCGDNRQAGPQTRESSRTGRDPLAEGLKSLSKVAGLVLALNLGTKTNAALLGAITNDLIQARKCATANE